MSSGACAKVWRCVGGCAILSVLGAIATAQGVLYDDFERSRWFDHRRWSGTEIISRWDRPSRALDLQRKVLDGKAWLESRAYGPGVNALFFAVQALDEVKATLRISRTRLVSCRGGEAEARAELFMPLFSSGAVAPAEDDGTDDVVASIGPVRRSGSTDPDGVHRVQWRLDRCADAPCGRRVALSSGELGKVGPNEDLPVEIRWSRLRDKVSFHRAGQASQTASYASADTYSPGLRKAIGIRHMSTCPPPATASSYMAVSIDDVTVKHQGDVCADAIRMPGAAGSYTLKGDTALLGESSYEGTCGGGGAPDAVYELALRTATKVSLSTVGSGFDTVLYVTQASGCLGAPLGCSDDAGTSATSSLTLDLTAGRYFVVVDGKNGQRGPYTLTVNLAPGAN